MRFGKRSIEEIDTVLYRGIATMFTIVKRGMLSKDSPMGKNAQKSQQFFRMKA